MVGKFCSPADSVHHEVHAFNSDRRKSMWDVQPHFVGCLRPLSNPRLLCFRTDGPARLNSYTHPAKSWPPGLYSKISMMNRSVFPRICRSPKSNYFFLIGARETGKTTWVRSLFKSEKILCIELILPHIQQYLAHFFVKCFQLILLKLELSTSIYPTYFISESS